MATAKDWNEFDFFYSSENLIVNGDFPVNTGNWDVSNNATLTWDNGRVRFNQTSGYRYANQIVNVVAGNKYKLTADIEPASTGASIRVRDGDTNSTITILSSSETEEVFTATSDTLNIQMRGERGAGYAYFDNLVLKPA